MQSDFQQDRMKEQALEILKKYWGHSSFRECQYEIIHSVLNKNDTLAILPTGGGKSVCFQIPALISPGTCLVISPLIALMEDQVKTLKNKGLKTTLLAGNITKTDLHRIMQNAVLGVYNFLYITPERLQNPIIQDYFKQLKINIIAIDEAHCISHWGNDFRPAYLACSVLKKMFPSTPIIALTASATQKIQQDIIQLLHLRTPQIIKKKLTRKNLAYMVYEVENKRAYLKQILLKNKESSIVYVRSRRLTIELHNYLIDNGFTSAYYHGGLSTEEKKQQMENWLHNKKQVMVATNAFGMGIDKPDVRTVIHWEIPPSIEDYFQEAGRAGRDEKKAFAITLYNANDLQKLEYHTQQSFISVDFLKLLYKKLCTYFHISHQQGENQSFAFDFFHFTQTYKLNGFTTFQGLSALERNGIIALTPIFSKKTEVSIIAPWNVIQNYLENNESEKEIMYYFMRSFTGISEKKVTFKIENLAFILKKNPSEITATLQRLHSNKIIEYNLQNTDYEITFLVPRDDDRTIHFFAKNIELFNQIKQEQAQKMSQYIQNKNKCKEQLLLAYFSEQSTENCGICSFCIAEKQKNNSINIEKEILNFIGEKPTTLKEICKKFGISEQEIVHLLKIWIDSKKIKRNNFNQYAIYE